MVVVLGGFLRRCGLWAQPPKSLESQNLAPLLMRDLQRLKDASKTRQEESARASTLDIGSGIPSSGNQRLLSSLMLTSREY